MLILLQIETEKSSFPFDTQYCPIIFESFLYNTSEVELAWAENDAVTYESFG